MKRSTGFGFAIGGALEVVLFLDLALVGRGLRAILFLFGHELQRASIHAIALSRRIRPIVKDMTEMGLASGAAHLRPAHEHRAILLLGNGALRGRGIKARPAAAGIVLGVGSEKRISAAHADIHAFAFFIEIGARERALRAVLARDVILF